VVDLRGATSAIPVGEGFFPSVPTGTNVPSRGYGAEIGAHVYFMNLGPARLGAGVGLLRVRGTASAVVAGSGSSSAASTPVSSPDVHATLTAVAPQLSINFGSAAGWSYLSAGVGQAKLTSSTSAFVGTGTGSAAVPAREADSGMLRSVNIGFGARWFAKPRLGVSFDVRAHIVAASAARSSGPATPRATLMAASVGVSVR
jgi:hypothetical protein